MPITLLTGIWGMNFETMPELKFPFAYPVALAPWL
jgi:magnesium transporter